MNRLLKFIIAGLITALTGCHLNNRTPALTNHDIEKVINQMTAVMVHDVTNPPLAARFFAYTCLSGYEITSQNNTQLRSMHGILNGYPKITKFSGKLNYNADLSTILAMYKTAVKLQPSGYQMADAQRNFLDSCKRLGFSDDIIQGSNAYADDISKAILSYAKNDGYNKISNFPRYSPSVKAGTWNPTPPAYMTPVEPYFSTIRSFTLDSASQFMGQYPVRFSTSKSSPFYALMLKNLRKSSNKLSRQETEIANFWDCNPFAVQASGHMLIGLKKISPGAHWLGIASIACAKQNASFKKTIQIQTLLAIGLMDSFICCWDNKYKTNRIRPETAIRKYIDVNWKPFLQTPPFPEYLSGHSVISASSSAILTYFLGDHFSFTDNVEAPYGIPPRKFNSFQQAANEAAISRFYGGIHFMDGITNGLIQGSKVGHWVIYKYTGKLADKMDNDRRSKVFKVN